MSYSIPPVTQKHLRCKTRQQGVVLIVALIMLVIISLLASFSIRNATSSEAVSGNNRTTQLASQAAEIALRYCEDMTVQAFSTPTVVVSQLPLDSKYTPRWQNMSFWDGSTSVTPANGTLTLVMNTTSTYVTSPVIELPADRIGQGTGTTSVTYKRLPECMVESVAVQNPNGVINRTSTFLVTARGFGPEVEAVNGTRDRPKGSEVWLQSTIELK